MPIVALATALLQFAPSIAKMFGASEPTVEVAGKIAGVAQAVTGATTPEEALTRLQQDADKQREFRLAMEQQENDLTKAYLSDTQNARARDVELAKAGFKNIRSNVLIAIAFCIVILSITVVVWMTEANDFVKGSITLLLGQSLGWINQAFNFEFGTTRGESKKDDTIKNMKV